MNEQGKIEDHVAAELPEFKVRLRIERERLGRSQDAFAGLGGVGKTSQWFYEQGRHWPTMEYIESLRQQGVDVGYLATGLRLNSEALRNALMFVLRLAKQPGRSFSDEQLFSVFRAVIEAAGGATRPDLVSQVPAQPDITTSERDPQ